MTINCTIAPELAPVALAANSFTLISEFSDDPLNLRKAYRYEATVHHPTHEAGVWRAGEPLESGRWAPIDSAPRFDMHTAKDFELGTLAEWRDAFVKLANDPKSALVMGRLADTARTTAVDGAWLVLHRKRTSYADRLSPWLIFDLDDIAGDVDDARNAVADFICEYMPELEGCAHVIAHTGSSGIKGLRVRLVFELAEARTLADCKAFAESVNRRAGRKLLDSSIYKPEHLIFMAAPDLFALVEDGAGTRRVSMPRPFPGPVALLVAGDKANIPAASAVATQLLTAAATSERLTKADHAALLQALGPGNYDVNIHALICSLAWKEPEHRRDAALAGAIDEIRERITVTSEPHKLQQRLRAHLDMQRLSRKWSDAKARQLAAMPPLICTPPQASIAAVGTTAAPQTIADVRAGLAADFAAAVASITGGNAEHHLFTHPPGCGKTRAIQDAMTPGTLVRDLWRILTPTHRLAEQLVADLKAHAATLTPDSKYFGTDLSAVVRHHKGRTQPGMCPDDDWRPVAERAERMGVSPKKRACTKCPTGKSGDCPWLNQFKDSGPGIVIETHANLVARNPRTDTTSIYIIDEGFLAAAIESDAKPVALDAIGKPRAIRKLRTSEPISSASIAHNALRTELVAALKAGLPRDVGAPGKLHMGSLTSLLLPVVYRDRVNSRWQDVQGTGIDELAALESQMQESLRDQIERAARAGKPTAPLFEQLHASREVERLCAAISASAAVAARDYVFGLAIYSQAENGKVTTYVRVVTKNTRITDVLAKGSITLDGTADESVWRALVAGKTALPTIVHRAAPQIEAGAVRVTQYADLSGARSSLVSAVVVPNNNSTPTWFKHAYESEEPTAIVTANKAKNAKAVQRKLRADSSLSLLHRFATYKALETLDRAVDVGNGKQASVLLVCQKAIKEKLQALGLPGNVALEHFGALRGLNTYKQIPCAIVIGRPRPSNIDLELMAEALASDDGSAIAIDRCTIDGKWLEAHPDPRAAAVQAVTTLAEIKQAVARIRPYDRTATAPCEVHVFGTYDTGLPDVRVTTWSDAERDWADIALARGALFSSPLMNMHAHPGLLPKANSKGQGASANTTRRIWRERVSQFADQLAAAKLDSIPNRGPLFAPPNLLIGIESNLGESFKLVKFVSARGGYTQFALVRRSWSQLQLKGFTGAMQAYRELSDEAAIIYASKLATPLDNR